MLGKHKDSEPKYYNGVMHRLTLLVTNMGTDNIVIKLDQVSRDDMLRVISDKLGDEYNSWTFRFLDGTSMLKPN